MLTHRYEVTRPLELKRTTSFPTFSRYSVDAGQILLQNDIGNYPNTWLRNYIVLQWSCEMKHQSNTFCTLMSHDIAFNVFLSNNSLWTYQLTDTAEDESWYAFNIFLSCGLRFFCSRITKICDIQCFAVVWWSMLKGWWHHNLAGLSYPYTTLFGSLGFEENINSIRKTLPDTSYFATCTQNETHWDGFALHAEIWMY